MVRQSGVDLGVKEDWRGHPETYRFKEMQILASWAVVGASGTIVGSSGSGKSNLLDLLCRRVDLFTAYLPQPARHLTLVLVRLGDLPDNNLATFYRVLLRAFHRQNASLTPVLREAVNRLYTENRMVSDPFLVQDAVLALITHFQESQWRVVLVLDGFDATSTMLTAEMGYALRGLYDEFKDTLSFFAGARRRLDETHELGMPDAFLRLLSTHACYVGPLTEADARHSIDYHFRSIDIQPTMDEIEHILELSGGYPTLLKAICRWRLLAPERPALSTWRQLLVKDPAIRRRLHDIWTGLNHEEQVALFRLKIDGSESARLKSAIIDGDDALLCDLSEKGFCVEDEAGWRFFSLLFSDYVAEVGGLNREKIWLDETTDALFQGEQLLDVLTPKERTVLRFLVKHPRSRHSYTDLIVSAWDEKERYHGVTNESLFQVIEGLRRKIEPEPSAPIYVVNYREKPEGGYLFYPEGKSE